MRVKQLIIRLPNRKGAFALVAGLFLSACGSVGSRDGDAPYGLAERVLWNTSRVVGSPEPPPPYRLRRVFPQYTFENPTFIAQDPNSERLLVAEYEGRIYSFQGNDPDAGKDLFLDWNRRVSAFSFHPRYRDNGQVFVFSPTNPKLEGKKDEEGNPVTQLSRVPGSSWNRGAIRRGCVPNRRRSSSSGRPVDTTAAKPSSVRTGTSTLPPETAPEAPIGSTPVRTWTTCWRS